MKFKIEKIIEAKDGRVYTVSQGNVLPVRLSRQTINDLVAQGMDREAAENLRGIGVSGRIMRAKYMETDIPIDDATVDLINKIRDKK
jgi:type IV pilus biogenesis protein CpaD/CtpE